MNCLIGWRFSYLDRKQERPSSCVNGTDKITEKQRIQGSAEGGITTTAGLVFIMLLLQPFQ